MKVIATDKSKNLHIPIIELRRIVEPGEIFELNEKAFNRLNGNGPSRIKFVEEYIEPVVEDPKVIAIEKPKKKVRKKKNENSD